MTFKLVEEIKTTELEAPVAQDHELSIESLNTYLHATFRTAVMVPAVYRKVLGNIGKAQTDSGMERLMFEYETALPLDVDANRQLVSDLVTALPGTRIALLARHQIHRPSIEEAHAFALETGSHFDAFYNPAAAEKWLLADL